jgi:eukaryotic-like serine/threonine-protein kinase
VVMLVLMVAVGGGALYLLIDQGVERTQRGTGQGRVEAPPGDRIISVKRTSAHDFDPLADQAEHREVAPLAVDQDPGTAWTTETYTNNILNKPRGTPGVGLYVDAEPSVDANAVEIQTPEPGWRMELFAARSRPLADEWPSDVWKRVGGGRVERRKQRFPLDTQGRSYRYYLVWITELPPGEGRVEITQATLFAPEAP